MSFFNWFLVFFFCFVRYWKFCCKFLYFFLSFWSLSLLFFEFFLNFILVCFFFDFSEFIVFFNCVILFWFLISFIFFLCFLDRIFFWFCVLLRIFVEFEFEDDYLFWEFVWMLFNDFLYVKWFLGLLDKNWLNLFMIFIIVVLLLGVLSIFIF